MRRIARDVGSVFAGLVVVVACGRPSHPSNPALVDKVCASTCRKVPECNPKRTVEVCQRECHERLSEVKAWRADYVDAVAGCIDGSDCATIGDKKALREKCFTALQPEASPRVKQFCTTAIERDRACGMGVDLDGCVDKFRRIDDTLMNDLAECSDRPCNNRAACAAEVVGSRNPT
jgi:hypothetical protein